MKRFTVDKNIRSFHLGEVCTKCSLTVVSVAVGFLNHPCCEE